jgi:hypothetical protein
MEFVIAHVRHLFTSTEQGNQQTKQHTEARAGECKRARANASWRRLLMSSKRRQVGRGRGDGGDEGRGGGRGGRDGEDGAEEEEMVATVEEEQSLLLPER